MVIVSFQQKQAFQSWILSLVSVLVILKAIIESFTSNCVVSSSSIPTLYSYYLLLLFNKILKIDE